MSQNQLAGLEALAIQHLTEFKQEAFLPSQRDRYRMTLFARNLDRDNGSGDILVSSDDLQEMVSALARMTSDGES